MNAPQHAHPRADEPDDAQRRRFLIGGSLVVCFALVPYKAQAADAAPSPLPGSLKTTPWLDAWIRIDPDGRVSVCTGKVELGTGVRTALLQVAADALDVPPHAITLITADTAITPNEGYTAGSHTLADSGTAIFNAAAQVRALLVASAATQLGVDAATLTTRDAAIVAPDGRRVGYGEAVRHANLHQKAQRNAPTKRPDAFTVIGQALPRADIPAKVTGGASYVQDLRLPDMVHARVIRPPAYGARLVAVDTARVEALPGVIEVVRDGDWLAVVADDEWRAIVAMRELALAAQWQNGAPLPEPATIHERLMQLPSQTIVVADEGANDISGAPSSTTLRARYTRAYLMHASIGPSCAIAQLANGTMTVWTHTQGVYPLRAGLAELLAMPPDNVRCIHVEGAGCYGHNGADDVAADAALLARALPGRAVRVQWMREDEHRWEPFGPAMIVDVSASLDKSGTITQWHYALWSNTHNNRIANAGRLLAAQSLAHAFTPAPPKPIPMPEGGGDRNSIPLYRVPRMDVQFHFIPEMPIRVSALRSLGAHMNVFAIESFIDELARSAHHDRVAFRLKHLDDPRARNVIETAAQRFGWRARTAPAALAPGAQRTRDAARGCGFAFAQYKNLMAYVAVAMEVTVQRETGEVRIERVVAAVDCGQIVNPDGVRNQIEGGIVQSTSWTLFEQVQFDRRGITSLDWGTYPIMRFSSMPRSIEVVLVDRPGLPFLGVGEAAQGPAAAALANAIDDATLVRLRDLPLVADAARRAQLQR